MMDIPDAPPRFPVEADKRNDACWFCGESAPFGFWARRNGKEGYIWTCLGHMAQGRVHLRRPPAMPRVAPGTRQ